MQTLCIFISIMAALSLCLRHGVRCFGIPSVCSNRNGIVRISAAMPLRSTLSAHNGARSLSRLQRTFHLRSKHEVNSNESPESLTEFTLGSDSSNVNDNGDYRTQPRKIMGKFSNLVIVIMTLYRLLLSIHKLLIVISISSLPVYSFNSNLMLPW